MNIMVIYLDTLTGELCYETFADKQTARSFYLTKQSAMLVTQQRPFAVYSKGVVKPKQTEGAK